MQASISIGAITPDGAEAARHAAERALALAPTRPEGHQALAAYYSNVPRRTTPGAIPETAPRSPWLPVMPNCSERWGGTNSTSAVGRRRGPTWSRLPGLIPAQAQWQTTRASAGQHPPLPRSRTGPRSRAPAHARQPSCTHESGDGGADAGRPRAGSGRDQRCAQGGGPYCARRVCGELPRPHMGAGRSPTTAAAATHAKCV